MLNQNDHITFNGGSLMEKIEGFVCATMTPFKEDLAVDLHKIPAYAASLRASGKVAGVFVNGSTGEFSSLTVAERKTLAEHWKEALGGSSIRLIIHVGSTSISDAQELARHAESIGAYAISAVCAPAAATTSLAPFYLRPRNLAELIDCIEAIAQ
eukprot:gene7974-7374_t